MNHPLACDMCGAAMQPATSGDLECPNGHGRYDQAGEAVNWQDDEDCAACDCPQHAGERLADLADHLRKQFNERP